MSNQGKIGLPKKLIGKKKSKASGAVWLQANLNIIIFWINTEKKKGNNY